MIHWLTSVISYESVGLFQKNVLVGKSGDSSSWRRRDRVTSCT